MRNWIQALIALLGLALSFPSAATLIAGADGVLAPIADYTLPYRADGIFDFSSIDIGAGITLRFDAGITNATIRSRGDFLLAGVIDATGINLAIENFGNLFLLNGAILSNGAAVQNTGTGSGSGAGVTLCIRSSIACDSLGISPAHGVSPAQGGSIILRGGDVILGGSNSGTITRLPPVGGSISLQPGIGGELAIGTGVELRPGSGITLSVPEPGTLWLMALLVPMLALLGRKRT